MGFKTFFGRTFGVAAIHAGVEAVRGAVTGAVGAKILHHSVESAVTIGVGGGVILGGISGAILGVASSTYGGYETAIVANRVTRNNMPSEYLKAATTNLIHGVIRHVVLDAVGYTGLMEMGATASSFAVGGFLVGVPTNLMLASVALPLTLSLYAYCSDNPESAPPLHVS